MTAFLVPVVLILISGAVKSVARGGGVVWDDFFLGIDLTMAAITTAFINVLDLLEPDIPSKTLPGGHVGQIAIWYIVGCFGAFIVLILFNQDFARKIEKGQPFSRKRHIFFLGIASNLIGIVLLGSFMFLKMGGKL